MSIRSEVVRIFNEILAGSKKISELTSLPSNVQNTDLIEVVRGSQNYKALGSQLPSGGVGSGGIDDVLAEAQALTDDREITVGLNVFRETATDGATHYSQRTLQVGSAEMIHASFDNTQQAIITVEDGIVITDTYANRGLQGAANFSANIQANDFTQKNYVDNAVAGVDLQAVMDQGSSAIGLATDVIVTTTENVIITSGAGNVSQMVNPDGGSVTVGENVAVTGNAVVITAILGDLDLSSAAAGTVKANGNPISSIASPSVDTTGTAISFAVPQIYGSDASPETGNITVVTTGLVKGMTQLLIHNNGSEPTYGSPIKIISGAYVTGELNYIMLLAVSTTSVLVTISQEV